METYLSDVAKAVNMDIDEVRSILIEKPGVHHSKEVRDKVFQAARKMQYDFKKLKLGKRMDRRKEVITDLLKHIESNADWDRKKIIDYMKSSCDMVERVHKRTFNQEFTK